MSRYEERIEQELAGYNEVEAVHELPEIYHYWSRRHVLPLLDDLGLASLEEWWDDEVAAVCAARAPGRARLVSLGAGNGDLETGMAARLQARGVDNLDVVLLELNPVMLERAAAHARRLGVADRVEGHAVDLNSWQATEPADVYLACHSLHHVVELEHLFDEVTRTLAPDGVMLVNDMIGRNGHRRWPEAASIVEGLWRAAAPRYRHNHYTGEDDTVYPDVDCSGEGFEGVRAQDILPLLLDRLHPAIYVTFANVVDPFVDRVYGPNFDPEREDDRRFIDAVAALDDAALDLGLLTPTHLVGSFRMSQVTCRHPPARSPQRTVRRPEDPPFDPVLSAALPAAVESTPAAPDRRLDELARSERAAWQRYQALRSRKIVRLGLALSALRHRRR